MKCSNLFVKQEINPIPCSLGVSNCQDNFNGAKRLLYKKSIQPNPTLTGYTNLNQIGLQFANDYFPYGCGVINQNPLLIDTARGIKCPLDRPHLTGELAVGNVEHDEIYTQNISKYGGVYAGYSSINNGQIQYYTDGKIQDAYFRPNFVSPALVSHSVLKDPMDNDKPEYDRHSLVPYTWNKDTSNDCLSFTHDTLEFRQELMEKQMRKRNQQRYTNRWGNH